MVKSSGASRAAKDNKTLVVLPRVDRPAPFGVRADGTPRKKPRPYQGETTRHPDPEPGHGLRQSAPPAKKAASVFLSSELRAETSIAAETQLARSERLLADDRAENLVPSIRESVIGYKRPGGEEQILRTPTAEKTDWRDPNDTSPNASRSPKRIKGMRKSNNLAWLRKRGAPLSTEHVVAGMIYEGDHEASQIGHYPGSPPPEIRGTPGPGDYSRRVDKGVAFRRAEKAIGPVGADLLRHVVLGREGAGPGDLAGWAATKRINNRTMTRETATGVLIATLDTLAVHYGRRIDDYLRAQT